MKSQGIKIPTEKLLYSEQEAADLLRLSISALRKMRRDRRITHVRFGMRVLYAPEDLYEFIGKNRVQREDEQKTDSE